DRQRLLLRHGLRTARRLRGRAQSEFRGAQDDPGHDRRQAVEAQRRGRNLAGSRHARETCKELLLRVVLGPTLRLGSASCACPPLLCAAPSFSATSAFWRTCASTTASSSPRPAPTPAPCWASPCQGRRCGFRRATIPRASIATPGSSSKPIWGPGRRWSASTPAIPTSSWPKL